LKKKKLINYSDILTPINSMAQSQLNLEVCLIWKICKFHFIIPFCLFIKFRSFFIFLFIFFFLKKKKDTCIQINSVAQSRLKSERSWICKICKFYLFF